MLPASCVSISKIPSRRKESHYQSKKVGNTRTVINFINYTCNAHEVFLKSRNLTLRKEFGGFLSLVNAII